MNKEQFIVVLQSALFHFDGATIGDILSLNPEYDKHLVIFGCKLAHHLIKKEFAQ